MKFCASNKARSFKPGRGALPPTIFAEASHTQSASTGRLTTSTLSPASAEEACARLR